MTLFIFIILLCSIKYSIDNPIVLIKYKNLNIQKTAFPSSNHPGFPAGKKRLAEKWPADSISFVKLDVIYHIFPCINMTVDREIVWGSRK